MLEKVESLPSVDGFAMTEFCIMDYEEMQGNGRDLGISPALYMARVIHYDMTVANASSWQWWLAISPYDYKDGLIYIFFGSFEIARNHEYIGTRTLKLAE